VLILFDVYTPMHNEVSLRYAGMRNITSLEYYFDYSRLPRNIIFSFPPRLLAGHIKSDERALREISNDGTNFEMSELIWQMANFTGNLLFLILQLCWTSHQEAKALIGFVVHVSLLAYVLFVVESVADPSSPDWLAAQSAHFSVLVVGMALSGAACASLQVCHAVPFPHTRE
jgi:hypothetical protein